jgi:hypothetical protein
LPLSSWINQRAFLPFPKVNFSTSHLGFFDSHLFRNSALWIILLVFFPLNLYFLLSYYCCTGDSLRHLQSSYNRS